MLKIGFARLQTAPGLIGLHCHIVQDPEELRRLADEQPIGGEGLDGSYRASNTRYPRRANDRDSREFATEEDSRLWHNQVGLGVLRARGVEIREH